MKVIRTCKIVSFESLDELYEFVSNEGDARYEDGDKSYQIVIDEEESAGACIIDNDWYDVVTDSDLNEIVGYIEV